LIPDPYLDCNEREVQWVAERDWIYRLEFEREEDPEATDQLCLDGLDTFCEVWLNGELLLRSDNMFCAHRLGVSLGRRNLLVLAFDSALRRGRELEQRFGKQPLWNGESSRLHVRKAQYQYGWDWGPTLAGCGPWREVRLERFVQRIAALRSDYSLDWKQRSGHLEVRWEVAGQSPASQLALTLLDPEGAEVFRKILPADLGQASFALADVQLWWPYSLGRPALYRLQAELLDSGVVCDRAERQVGFRQLRLVQEPDSAGRSFYFEVNGRALFAGGANWIPEHLDPSQVSEQRYRQRLEQAVSAHMAMLRVWGGGIYEHDTFYRICDQLGLLVWQDFPFACGIYPTYPDFVASVKAEAEQAIARLREHPSLALWCGNNEDYLVAESIGLDRPGAPRFLARTLYEELLPALCHQLDPQRPYWPGSPYGGERASDPGVGDRHTWEIWHGAMAPYQDYPKFGGRFVSEFGMQSLPALSTLRTAISADQLTPGSPSLVHHNKAGEGEQRQDHYLELATGRSSGWSLEERIYLSQWVQAEAMRRGVLGFRRGWNAQREVGGALVWQLNDVWPGPSWSLIDYLGRRKAAYFAVQRALSPLAVDLEVGSGEAQLWLMAAPSALGSVHVSLRAMDLAGRVHWEGTRDLPAQPDGSLPLRWAGLPSASELLWVAGAESRGQRARALQWPQRGGASQPPPEWRWSEQGLEISSPGALRNVWVWAETELDRNAFDMLPGERATLPVSPEAARSLWWLDPGSAAPHHLQLTESGSEVRRQGAR
jgi:beta-mannosidase